MPQNKENHSWSDLAAFEDLAEGRLLDFEKALLYRDGEDVHAVSKVCSHMGYPLVEGVMDSEQKTVTCPWHGWEFSFKDGKCLRGGRDLACYPVKIENGRVLVDLEGSESPWHGGFEQ